MTKNQDPQSALDQLQSTMRECQLCIQAGYDVYPKAIFSGMQDAQVMIIGQAPGVTEVDAGRPFNAGSGTRLFQWLAKAGIEEDSYRSTQYMTSVTKCFPGKDKNGSGDRVPTKAEQVLCRPYLEQEISLIQPKLIIPVGRLAINLFFPSKDSLANIIGTEIEIQNQWIIPLPHPSGASRWHQVEENRRRIELAIKLIRAKWQTLS
jgi:uracil-DNA glycosylase